MYISGQDSSRIFYMDFEGVPEVEMYLEDLAIIEGNQYVSDPSQWKNNGGAVMAIGLSKLELNNLIIRDNQVKLYGIGGAFFLFQCSSINIDNCLVEGNHSPSSIVGVTIDGSYAGGFYINSLLVYRQQEVNF